MRSEVVDVSEVASLFLVVFRFGINAPCELFGFIPDVAQPRKSEYRIDGGRMQGHRERAEVGPRRLANDCVRKSSEVWGRKFAASKLPKQDRE